MSKPQRAFALVLALLFLGTSIAFTVMVLFQMEKDKQDASSTQPTANETANLNESEDKKMLQGTKLEGFTPINDVSELKVIDLKEGTGEEVKEGATVVAHYTGALAKDGTIFQSSHDSPTDEPIEFSLAGVIEGWTKGVPGMKVGGVRRLIIPYALAYGEEGRPSGGIPPKADLVFDIELASVK